MRKFLVLNLVIGRVGECFYLIGAFFDARIHWQHDKHLKNVKSCQF
jgi:hypothetical protein